MTVVKWLKSSESVHIVSEYVWLQDEFRATEAQKKKNLCQWKAHHEEDRETYLNTYVQVNPAVGGVSVSCL